MTHNENLINIFYQSQIKRIDSHYFDGNLDYTKTLGIPTRQSNEILEITFDGKSNPLAAYLDIHYTSGQPVIFTFLPSELNRLISEFAVALPLKDDMFRRVAIRVSVQYPRDFPFRAPQFTLPEGDFPTFFIERFKCFTDCIVRDFSPVYQNPEKHILIFNHYMDILDSMQRLCVVKRKTFPSSAVIIGDIREQDDCVCKKLMK